LFTVKLHTGKFEVTPAATGMKPELTPLGIAWHGLAKVDCVTVWFFAINWNWMVSPT